MANPTANVFIIAENPDLVAHPRSITLHGRSLPFQGVGWGTKQRVDINYFPGNPVAISQVIGPTWDDTKIQGRWSDIFLQLDEHAPELTGFNTLAPGVTLLTRTDTLAPGVTQLSGTDTYVSGGALPPQRARTAAAVRDAFYSITRQGQPLRVEWNSLVRYGFIGEFVPTHDRQQDIDWTIRFEWVGDTYVQPAPAPESKDMVSTVKSVIDQIADVIDFIRSQRELVEAYRLEFEEFVEGINAFARDLLSTLERLIRTRFPVTPEDLFGSTKGSLSGIVKAVRDMLAHFETEAAGVKIARVTGGNAADVAVIDGLQREFRRLAARLAAKCRSEQATIDRFSSPKIRVIVRPFDGATLRDISLQEFGTPDNWRAIQEFNGFPDSLIPPGTVVRVPDIPTVRTPTQRRRGPERVNSLNVTGVI